MRWRTTAPPVLWPPVGGLVRVVGGDDGPLGSASGLPSRIEDATAEAVAGQMARLDELVPHETVTV